VGFEKIDIFNFKKTALASVQTVRVIKKIAFFCCLFRHFNFEEMRSGEKKAHRPEQQHHRVRGRGRSSSSCRDDIYMRVSVCADKIGAACASKQ
jgi:hypothetical protein